jgi:hypothetical protein
MASDYSATLTAEDDWAVNYPVCCCDHLGDCATCPARPERGEQPITMPPNPKQAYGDKKIPMTLAPSTFIAGTNLAMLEGMLKYGESNYLAVPSRR